MIETTGQFEQRKRDHLTKALEPWAEARELSQFDQITLNHEALPDLDFNDVDLSTHVLGQKFNAPLFISSMTAGHTEGQALNLRLAEAAATKSWLMGVGSQRRELFDPAASNEWKKLKEKIPSVKLAANLGIAQVIQSSVIEIEKLVSSLGAVALFIHLNSLQECLQSEGTPQFKGGLQKLKELAQELSAPLIVKEVGCGFSPETLKRLDNIGLSVIDISGAGGTHWGRVEGLRTHELLRSQAANTFKNWGCSTVESLYYAKDLQLNTKLWASGGVRSGLEAAKLIALGAEMVGFAKPILEAAQTSTQAVIEKMNLLEFELKVALFCTGCQRPQDLSTKKVWQWRS